MLKRFFLIVTFVIANISIYAQETCIINGYITNGNNIKKVQLVRTDEYGRKEEVATAKVKKGTYKFKYTLSQDEPVMLYTITGLGDNCIELFIEPGTITVETENAEQPEKSKVYGTATNDTFYEYKKVLEENSISDAASFIKRESERIKFLINHNASPMTPFEMERSVMPNLSETYAEQMVKCISTTLHKHPYYRSFRNAVLARSLKVGNEVPDITIPLIDNKSIRLADFRGKYILLDLWASNCEKSMQERANLKGLYDVIKDKQDKFVIISLSLDDNKEEWINTIKNNALEETGWIHGCDTTGKTIKFFGAENTPRMILIDPEGRAISLDIKGDELIEKAELILSGDLYYLDQKD